MNDVYNVMDVFLLTTSGEGFGIPILEAQSCGIPTLVTNYTTTYELCIEPKTGLGIDLVGVEPEENPIAHETELIDGVIVGSWNVDRGICSIKDCARKLEILEKDNSLRLELGKNGRLNALENYSWDIIGRKWIEYIEDLGNGI